MIRASRVWCWSHCWCFGDDDGDGLRRGREGSGLDRGGRIVISWCLCFAISCFSGGSLYLLLYGLVRLGRGWFRRAPKACKKIL
jgi:hypothetical protein